MAQNIKPKGSPTVDQIIDKGIPPELTPDIDKMQEFRENAEIKRKILDLFESLEVSTLSQAAEKVGISKYRAYKMRREDPDWSEELKVSHEIVADRIEGDLVDPNKLKEEKYAGVMARIFLLNGLRPNKYKGTKLTIENPKLEQMIEDIKKAGKNEP